MPEFDLFFLPFRLPENPEQEAMPGLLAAAAPRRATRTRAGDLLLALLTLPGEALPQQEEVLQQLAGAYFSSQGSVTRALQSAAETLNDFLLGENQTASAPGGQAAGILNLASVHNQVLTVAHAGPTHTFVINRQGSEDFSDAALAGRGLGLSSEFSLRFFQTTLTPGDLLVFCPRPPAAWTSASLADSSRTTLESLRRRLINQSSGGASAVLAQVQAGRGVVHLLKPHQMESMAVPPLTFIPETPQPEAASPAPESAAEPEELAPVAEPPAYQQPIRFLAPEPPEERPAPQPEQPEIAVRSPASRPPAGGVRPVPSAGGDADAPPPPPQAIYRRRTRQAPVWRQRLDEAAAAARGLWQKLSEKIAAFKPTLPKGLAARLPSPQQAAVSPAMLLFIAVAVPVAVVAVATTVYLRTGQGQQRLAYLVQAQSFAAQAMSETDPTLQRGAWSQALYWVRKAEEYDRTPETLLLHQQAQQALDNIEGVARVQLKLALPGGLPGDASITQIAATAADAYLLDSSEGRIHHLAMTDQGYSLDPAFNCGPGPSGGKTVGPLIDLALLPTNNQYKASLLAMDSSGNLLYCIPDAAPLSTTLKPPDVHWGRISAFTLEQGTLYVLDATSNAVYRYAGDGAGFGGSPQLFFDKDRPNLLDVVDLAVYQDDLYLLHASGQMTVCVFSGFDFSPTRCTDPSPYGDPVTGKQSLSFLEAKFTRMLVTQPPDPSLYILDMAVPSIYHFSLRLNLQRQLRIAPDEDTPPTGKTITGFTITSGRVAYAAYGGLVYYGALP